jgi:uncharacterized OsmC-like protein
MSLVKVVYDALQHCTASAEVKKEGVGAKSVSMDCPYTGEGAELSPGNLLGASVAGCMLLSMGVYAKKRALDLTGTTVDVEVGKVRMPGNYFKSIDIVVNMPQTIPVEERDNLEKAAETCPIKHSLRADVALAVQYQYSNA